MIRSRYSDIYRDNEPRKLGKLFYFGVWADPEAALRRYLTQKDDLYAGRKPRDTTDGHTVADACNKFLKAKRTPVDVGEISERYWDD